MTLHIAGNDALAQGKWCNPILHPGHKAVLTDNIPGLITSRFEMYNQRYALDYCGNLADLVASGILVSCWRSPGSSYFGNRRDRGGNQARHRSRGIAFDCAGSPSQRLTKTSNQLIALLTTRKSSRIRV